MINKKNKMNKINFMIDYSNYTRVEFTSVTTTFTRDYFTRKKTPEFW